MLTSFQMMESKSLALQYYCIPKYYQKLQFYSNICSVFGTCKYPNVLHTKYVLHKLKINPAVKKIQNYRNKWIRHVRRRDRDRLTHLIVKYQPFGKEAKDDPSKDFSTVSGIGTGHEDQQPASYMMMVFCNI